MSTFADLLANVKSAVRETTAEKDTFIVATAGRLYRQYLRSDDWPQSRVQGYTIALTSGAATYDLPADFSRFAGDRVFYVQTGAQYPGIPLPVLSRGTIEGDRQLTYWENLNNSTVASMYPGAVGLVAGGANTYQIVFYPTPSITGYTATFDYYSSPAARSTTQSTIIIDPLYETMVNATIAEYYRYENNNSDAFTISSQLAQVSHRNAKLTLFRL